MGTLDHDWPDADRRDAGLLRCLADTYRSQPRAEPSRAELRVLEAISHGLDCRGAAELLGLSYWTVRSQLRDARTALGCKTAAHAAAECLRRGLIR